MNKVYGTGLFYQQSDKIRYHLTLYNFLPYFISKKCTDNWLHIIIWKQAYISEYILGIK